MAYIDVILTTIMWILGIIATGVIGFIIHKELQFKHKAVIKRVNNSVRFTYIDKFKESKDDQGIITWVFRKNKISISPAPNECIEIDNKGRYIVQYYQLDGGELIPGKDKFDLSDDKVKQKIISEAQPYTYSQRQIMVNQHNKSLQHDKKSLKEWLMVATPLIAVVMILTIFMIFFGDVIEPINGLADKLTVATENIDGSLKSIESIVHDRITIDRYEEVNAGNWTPPN